MKVLVLLNESAGTLAASATRDVPKRIGDAFRAAGHDVEVRSVAPADLQRASRDAAAPASGYDAVVAGGGDGTLNSIAAALAGSGKAFGVLPLGTHNHFAKDMNVPLDLDAAAAALARGTVRDVDIGEVNGRIFLNFSGIGLHPLVVRHREAQRTALGRTKFVALFFAMLRVLRRPPLLRVRIDGDNGLALRRLTPSVIVCNNPHQMKVFGVQNCSYPGRGVLNVYLARSTGWLGLLWLIVRATFRRLNAARGFESMALPEVTIHTRRRTARVSIDGEVTDVDTPLRYRVRRGGLKVIVPNGTR
jgi:diacylglycerol kinase family enzyme